MLDFNRSPFLVIWEVTRACALKCLHCRAEAQYHRDPRELSTEEGKALIRQIREMGAPLLVFTGGDPLMRDDLFELAVYAKEQGLLVSLTPSATPRVTEKAMRQAKEIGLDRWAFSLDGSTAEIHDAFRGTRGSFALTMRAIETLRRLGMPLQINTTVSRYNLGDLPNIARLLEEMGVVLWSVFFLVPTGRGKLEDMISAEAHERVFHWLADLAERVPFDIKTTAAPHYRRVLLQRAKAKAKTAAAGGTAQEAPSF
ncbi:radical SAM protein, partial [Calditerricola satsumensis]